MSRRVCLLLLLLLPLSLGDKNILKFWIKEETGKDMVVGVLATSARFPERFPDRYKGFTYALMRGSGSQFFKIHPPDSSILRVNRRIDRETLCQSTKDCCLSKSHRECRIVLHVNANRDSVTEVSLQVEVFIKDVNDNGCSFRSPSQNVSFFENEVSGRAVIDTPVDKDAMYSVQKDRIRLEPAFGHPFRLRVTELATLNPLYRLEVTHVKALDREKQSHYELSVIADDGKPSHMCKLRLFVEVRDVNDNAPEFDQSRYSVNVSELAGRDTRKGDQLPVLLVNVHATDKDLGQNARLLYSIETALVGPEIEETFDLNPATGDLMLRRPLQYENHRQYIIPIIVKDGGVKARTGSATVTVSVIDENDNKPEITVRNKDGGTEISVREGVAKRVSVASIRVSDADSGRNGEVSCTLRQPDSGVRSFDFKPMGPNAYQVISERSFDREKVSQVSFTITCLDGGTPPERAVRRVVMNVLDVNDHAPEFTDAIRNVYRARVTEDSAPSRSAAKYFILTIHAIDKDAGQNGEVRYRLNSPEATKKEWPASEQRSKVGTDLVSINPTSGTVSSLGRLDRETLARFHFEVVAYDQGMPVQSTTATVRVDVDDFNDHQPVFEMPRDRGYKGYNLRVRENAPSGEFVGEVSATDGDEGENARLTFKLERDGTSKPSPFKVVPTASMTNGRQVARIFTTAVIDRESLLSGNSRDVNPVYNLMLVAEDGGGDHAQTSSVHVNIHVDDENDETPSFSFPINNASLRVSYLEPADFQIMKMETRDNDEGENGTVRYRIVRGNQLNYFAIDPDEGALRLAVDMPKSAVGEYALTIEACDRGRHPRAATTLVLVTIVDGIPLNLKRLQGGRTAITNLYIIVAIVVGSAVISVVLLTAICIVIRRSRRDSRDAKRADYPLCPNAERRESYDASYPTAGYSTGRREVTFSPTTMDTGSFRLQYHDLTTENKRGSLASNADKDSGNGDSLDVNSGMGHRFGVAHNHMESRSAGASPYTACVTPVMRTFSPNSGLEPYTPLSFDSRANVIMLEENRTTKKFAIASTAGTLPRRKQSPEASFV